MVWHGHEQRCAVYGRHLGIDEYYCGYRNKDAPGAALVDLCASTPAFLSEHEITRNREYSRHVRAAARERRRRREQAA